MMNDLDLNLFYEDSFVDFRVTNTKISFDNRLFILDTVGAWLDREENNLLCKAVIHIKNWVTLEVTLLNEETKAFSKVENIQDFILQDIIKFYNDNNILQLIGFGINGGWVKWEFVKPEISINGEVAIKD